MSSLICPSCRGRISASADACPSCGSTQGQNYRSVILPGPKQLRIPVHLCLAVLTDATGSSAQFAEGVRQMGSMFVKPVAAKVAGLTIYHQIHRDLDYGEQAQMISAGVNAEQFLRDAERVVFEGGGDGAETHFDAMEEALVKVPWPTEQSRRYRSAMIVFANAPSKPSRSGRSPSQIGEAIAKRGIDLYLIVESDCAWKELAKPSEAYLFPITNSPTADECARVAQKLGASITGRLTAQQSPGRRKGGLTIPLIIEV